MAKKITNVRDLEVDLRSFTTARIKTFAERVMANLTGPPPVGTPIDTGFASSNWVVTSGRPFQGVIGSKESVDTSVQKASVAALSKYRLKQGPLFVNNNCPYIDRLNGGWSGQSPAGFVEAAIERAKAES